MIFDDEFKPKLGKGRSRGGAFGDRFVNRVMIVANRMRGGPIIRASGRKGSFDGSRIGRGAGVGRVLSARGGASALRQRRVIIKSRIVRMTGKASSFGRAHLSYIQRDGVTRDGQPGQLYDRTQDRTDGGAFIERGEGDRHQFRFIVSPEDGAQYDDLKPVVRRLMAQMEEDLGTKLDWVAVDHYNTDNPHSHIILHGKDDLGKDLIIARDYIANGMRERAAEIVSFDLGPRLDYEIDHALQKEVTQERFTSLDKTLIKRSNDQGWVTAHDPDSFRQSVLVGRLQTLKGMGLAEEVKPGQWQIDPDLEPILKRMGERGDIIKTLHQALTDRGRIDKLDDSLIHEPGVVGSDISQPLTGRVIKRGLIDELDDRQFLIVEATDGRVHYLDIGKGHLTEATPLDAIISVVPRAAEVREVDRTIARIAARGEGLYAISEHQFHDPSASYEFAKTHQRRVEAIRRHSGNITRIADGVYNVGNNYLQTALDYEKDMAKASPVKVDILSSQSLEAQIAYNGPTWLDKVFFDKDYYQHNETPLGQDIRGAVIKRVNWLVDQGLVTRSQGMIESRSDLTDILKGRELRQAADQLSKELGLDFRPAKLYDAVEGKLSRAVIMGGNKYALIERSHEFSLVPWKPALDNHIGEFVSGQVKSNGISWDIGRQRGLGL